MCNCKLCSVIMEGSNYVPGNKAFFVGDDEIVYCSLTGKTTGFIHYSDQNILDDELRELNNINIKYNLGKKFIKKIIDLKSVKKGKLVIENISLSNISLSMIHNKVANG